jgi:hypothetical protein
MKLKDAEQKHSRMESELKSQLLAAEKTNAALVKLNGLRSFDEGIWNETLGARLKTIPRHRKVSRG